jgi:pilus assembly protein CpaB
LGEVNKKIVIMGGIAIVFGGLSVIAADFWLKSNVRTVVETVETTSENIAEFDTIVVAAEPMRYGALIDPGMVKEIPWAKDSIPQGAFSTIDGFLEEGERFALAAIDENEPLLTTKVTGPGERATLSRRIEDGKRAMTIRVDDITGVAGFVVPGDHVDLALTRTFTVEKDDADKGEEYAPIEVSPAGDRTYTGETDSFVATTIVLTDVKVLSIDQIADERQAEPVVVRAVTIEVDALGAKAVSAAQQAGTLSLHLRGAGDVAPTKGLIEHIADLPPAGIDNEVTASFETDSFRAGIAKVTVRRKIEAETYDVRDEEVTQ